MLELRGCVPLETDPHFTVFESRGWCVGRAGDTFPPAFHRRGRRSCCSPPPPPLGSERADSHLLGADSVPLLPVEVFHPPAVELLRNPPAFPLSSPSRLHQAVKLYLFSSVSGGFSCPLAMTDGAAKIAEVLTAPLLPAGTAQCWQRRPRWRGAALPQPRLPLPLSSCPGCP